MADQNVRARKIPEALWTLHRDEIIALYRTRELRGQDGVMDIMMRKHGFKAK